MKTLDQITPGMKNLALRVILLERKFSTKLKSDQIMVQFVVGDASGCALCNFYDEVGMKLKESDIVELTGAYSSLFKQNMVIYTTNKKEYGKVKKVGEFYFQFNVKPNFSERKWEREWNENDGVEKYVKLQD